MDISIENQETKPAETILIVEDNDVLREGLRDMLSIDGYIVATARNGQEALALLKTCQPDLILSDIAMPVMDGFEFYRTVRSQPEMVSIPFLFLTAKTDPDDIFMGRNLGVDDYLTKPISREELVTTIKSRLTRWRQIQVAQLQKAYLASLTALANAVDLRETPKGDHVARITGYSLAMANRLGWKKWQIEPLRFGVILHDIGKIHIPERVLFKITPLNEEDWEIIKQHPVIGAEMVKAVPYLDSAVPIVRHHHERWDGEGYPDGLTGEEIPPGARIVAIADAFESMMLRHPYRAPLSMEEAYREIVRFAGIKYDPNVVTAFQNAWNEGEIQAIASDS